MEIAPITHGVGGWVSLRAGVDTLEEIAPITHGVGGWVSLRAGVDTSEERKTISP
jgi:ribosomal 30S subunit maturation factor RimM